VEIGTALIAGAGVEGMQYKAAFADPASCAELAAVGGARGGEPRGDASGAQLPAVAVEVTAPVGEQLARSPAWPATQAADRRYGVEPRNRLGDAIAVAAGNADRQR
jgi:hypothetical protein